MLIPNGKEEFAALIAPVRCQQKSINTNDKELALKCLKEIVPRAAAIAPFYLPHPRLEALLTYAAALVLKLIAQFELGVGTIQDVNDAYKSVVIRMIPDVRDLAIQKKCGEPSLLSLLK